MNYLSFRFLQVSALLLSISLASCGDSTTPASKNGTDKQKPAGQVVAIVNGEEITIHELNNELSRIRVTQENRESMANNLLKAMVVRTIFEQNARKLNMDRSPNIMMELERSKSAILAKAYLESQLIRRPKIPRGDLEAYILNNPDKFSNRAYYTFDSINVSTSYMTKEKRLAWEDVRNLDEIESILLREGIAYKRMPYTTYSDALPDVILKDIEMLKQNKDAFFIINKNTTFISIYQDHRPAMLSGDDALDSARKHLRQEATKKFLLDLESDSFKTSDIEYLDKFTALNEQSVEPVSEEIKEAVDSTVFDSESDSNDK